MPPITWQNVNAPATMDPSRALALGQSAFNSGFDNLNNVLKQRADLAEANWNQEKTNHTQALMNDVLAAQTPEEFQAKRAALVDTLKGYGAQVDAPLVNKAIDERLGTLQQRAVQGIKYKNDITDDQQQPLVNQIRMMVNSQDPLISAQGRALAQQHPELRVIPDIVKEGTTTFNHNAERERQDALLKIAQDKAPYERRHLAAQTAASNAEAGYKNLLGPEVAREHAANANKTEQEALEIAAYGMHGRGSGTGKAGDTTKSAEKALKHSLLADNFLGTPEADDAVEAKIKKIGLKGTDGDKIRAGITRVINDGVPIIGRDGKPITDRNGNVINMPVPTQVAIEAINDSKEGLLTNRGSDALSLLKKSLSSPQTQARIYGAIKGTEYATPEVTQAFELALSKAVGKTTDAGVPDGATSSPVSSSPLPSLMNPVSRTQLQQQLLGSTLAGPARFQSNKERTPLNPRPGK